MTAGFATNTNNPSSARATMTELAVHAQDTEHAERNHMEELRMLGLMHASTIEPSPMVEGRVFQRMYRYHFLPVQLQLLSDAVAMYLLEPVVRDRVFGGRSKWRHPHAVGPIVRGQKLIDTIQQYLVNAQADNVSDVLDSAQQIAEALVLSGFVSPVHEPIDEDNILTYVNTREDYELVAPGAQQQLAANTHATPTTTATNTTNANVTRDAKMSVWAVADGATCAGFAFRKPDPAASSFQRVVSKLSALCGAPTRREKKCYAVINKPQHHALFVFATDCARQHVSHIDLQDALVQYELGSTQHPLHSGLKISTDSKVEVLDFVSLQRQENWLLAMLDAGAKYVESNPAHATWASARASFYSLQDTTADGREFVFDELIGNVVLVVNVASKDAEAPVQFPQLVTLANLYQDDGLVVIACPSDQLGDNEFETDAEIVEFVTQVFGAQFPILSKCDVNGPTARPAFLYLNAHLPGRFGPFTDSNFTKFLIARDGTPTKRYGTCDVPLAAIEHDIRTLLSARVVREGAEGDSGATDAVDEEAVEQAGDARHDSNVSA